MKCFATRQRRAAFLMALGASLILLAYEVLRSSSYTLLKQAFGVESLPYILAVLPFVVAPILVLYNKSLTRFGPKGTFFISLAASASGMALLWSGLAAGYPWVSAALMLFREMYIVVLIEQVWSFINSSLDEAEGRLLNGPLLGIISIGPILGGLIVAVISQHIGTTHLVLLAACLTLSPALIIRQAYRFYEPQSRQKVGLAADSPNYGFSSFVKERNLLLILGMIVAAQIYATVAEIGFQMSLSEAYPEADLQTAMSGRFFAFVHLASFLLQALIAPLLMRLMSVNTLHIGIPLMHMVLITATFIEPGLISFGAAFFVFKGIDYSIFRAAKEVLYIPLSFDARYRAKEWIDVLGYRASKGGTAMLLGGVQKLVLALPLAVLSVVGGLATVLWTASALSLAPRKRVVCEGAEKARELEWEASPSQVESLQVNNI